MLRSTSCSRRGKDLPLAIAVMAPYLIPHGISQTEHIASLCHNLKLLLQPNQEVAETIEEQTQEEPSETTEQGSDRVTEQGSASAAETIPGKKRQARTVPPVVSHEATGDQEKEPLLPKEAQDGGCCACCTCTLY